MQRSAFSPARWPFTGGAISAGFNPANAVEGFALERLAGADRYATAAAIADEAFPNGATTAIIARGDVFADALAANYLAGVVDAPILLTDTNRLPEATSDALASRSVWTRSTSSVAPRPSRPLSRTS